MLFEGAAGIKITQRLWHLLGFLDGDVSVAVPLGGAAGAIAGALLGVIDNPRLLVLLMALFAGASAGAVAGRLPGVTLERSSAKLPGRWSARSPGPSGCSSGAAGARALTRCDRAQRVPHGNAPPGPRP